LNCTAEWSSDGESWRWRRPQIAIRWSTHGAKAPTRVRKRACPRSAEPGAGECGGGGGGGGRGGRGGAGGGGGGGGGGGSAGRWAGRRDSVAAMELRALAVLDSLQPQLTGFLQTVCSGFMPLEEEAALFLEIAPGIAINQLTDVALKATTCRPGMQIVERAYGMLELHDADKGQVEVAAATICERLGVPAEDRLRPNPRPPPLT